MSKIIKIPLEGGFDNQSSPEAVGVGLTNIENLENLNKGALTQRDGYGTAVEIGGGSNDKLVLDIDYWIKSSTLWWLAYDRTSKQIIRITEDFTTATTLGTLSGGPNRINISNWGNLMRFANGTSNYPSQYQYIDREYFHNGDDFFHSYDGYHYDSISHPREPNTWTYSPTSSEGISGEVSAGGQLTVNTDYYYKIVPLFDGDQLACFEDVKFGAITTSSGNLSCKIFLTLDTADYNPRITGCKIYRADTPSAIPKNAEYRLIKTLNFITSQVSWLSTNEAYIGRRLFAHSLTYDYTGWGTKYWTFTEYATATNSFLNVNNKFLWSSTDVDGDKWNESLSGTMYIHTHNSQRLTNPSFSGGTTGWTITGADTSYSSYGGGAMMMEEPSYVPGGWDSGWLVSEGSKDFYQTIDCTGATEIQVKHNAWETESYVAWGCRLETSAGVQVSVGAKRNNAGTYYDTLSTGGYSSLRLVFTSHQYDSTGFSNIKITEVYAWTIKNTVTTGYTHQSMFAVADNGIADGTAVGKVAKVLGSDHAVVQNQGDIFKVSGSAGWISSVSQKDVSINGSEVSWLRTAEDGSLSATQTKMQFVDVGEVESSYHPFSGVSSLNSKFKYSTSVGGRQYVGNVTIADENGVEESHTDMVLFSELNQPDVIPISNFIKLNDQQGGDITGIKGLFSDVVVFAERGIFRISVPSEDPTSWSMVEAEKNLGCTQPYSIVEYRGGIFFAGTDNLWYISPNFDFVPLAEPWKDAYQSNLVSTTDLDDTKIKVDIKNERLICKIGTEKDMLYLMDLRAFANKKILWFKNSPAESSANEGEIHSLTIKNDNTFYLLNKMDAQDSTKIRPISGGTGNNTPLLKTGVIFFRSLTDNDNAFIRRINFNMYSNVSITDRSFEVKCFIDHSSENSDYLGSEKIVTKTLLMTEDSSTGTDNYYSVRIGRRAKSLQLQLKESVVFGGENGSPLKIKGIEIEID